MPESVYPHLLLLESPSLETRVLRTNNYKFLYPQIDSSFVFVVMTNSTIKPRFSIFRLRINNALKDSINATNDTVKKLQEEASSTKIENDTLSEISRSIATFSSFDADDNLVDNKIPPKICFHMDIFSSNDESNDDNDLEIFISEGGKILFEI